MYSTTYFLVFQFFLWIWQRLGYCFMNCMLCVGHTFLASTWENKETPKILESALRENFLERKSSPSRQVDAMTSRARSMTVRCSVFFLRSRPPAPCCCLLRCSGYWRRVCLRWQPGRWFFKSSSSHCCVWRPDEVFRLCFRCTEVPRERRREKVSVAVAAIFAASSAARCSVQALGSALAQLPQWCRHEWKDKKSRPR